MVFGILDFVRTQYAHRFQKMKPKIQSRPWRTAPISRTCEFHGSGTPCGKLSLWAYRAMGGGWMSMCPEHGEKHRSISHTLRHLVMEGEILL